MLIIALSIQQQEKRLKDKMMKRARRGIALALVATIMMSGCDIQDKKGKDVSAETFGEDGQIQGSEKERYVECLKELPFESDDENVISMDKDMKGNLHIISRNSQYIYHDYQMNPSEGENSKYEEKDISWLHEMVPDENSWLIDARMDVEGNPVVCVVNSDGQWMVAKENVQTTLADCPGGFAMTEDNYIVLPYDRNGMVIDWDGKERFSFDKGMSPSTISQAADTCRTLIACKNAQEDAVVVYDVAEKSKVTEIAYPFNKDEDVVIRFDDKKNVYIADKSGIHRAGMTDTSFTTLVDSKAATIGMTTSMVTGMEIDNSGNIWCVVEDFNTGRTELYCYSYMQLKGIESTMTLYTMKESDWLKKIVIDFQNAYPQYRINMVLDNDKTLTTQDKLRNLHAQLLAGTGPDILMLDGLPVNSYVEKGILSDISDCVESSDMIDGVKNTAKTKDGIYAVATRMGIPVVMDTQGEASMLHDIDSLKQSLQKKEIKLSAIEADALAEMFAVVYYDELFTETGELAEDKLDSLLEAMRLMKEAGYVVEINEYAQGIMEEHGDRFGLTCLPTFGWNASMSYNLATDEANVALQECWSISMEVLGISSHLDKKMSVLKNMYFPYGQLGVNSGSESQDAAKLFVSFALSEQEQSIYVEDGLPVTYAGLASLTKVQNPNVGMGFNLPDGSELELRWPTEAELGTFAELCKTVDKKQHIELVIVQMLKAQYETFLMGEASEQETGENITNQIKTFLEEQQ